MLYSNSLILPLGNYLKPNKNLKFINEDIRAINSKNFRNIYAIIDLAAISNDPSGEKFKKQTYEINFEARVKNAKMARNNNVKRYRFNEKFKIYYRKSTGKKIEFFDEPDKNNAGGWGSWWRIF